MTPGETEGLRESFRSTSAGGLDRASVPMRLWEKGERLGTYNPADVDLERDAEQWGRASWPMPFGLELDAFVGYATDQFSRRMDRIERARGESLEAVRRSMGG